MSSLDTKTIYFLYFLFTILNSSISVFVWIQNRHLRGIPEISCAYIIGGIGLVIQSVAVTPTSPLALFAANLLVNFSHGLGVNGLGVFFGRKNRLWLPISAVVFTILVWPPALYFVPEDRALRIAAATVVTLVSFGYLLIVIGRGRRANRWVRRIVSALTIGHIMFGLARAYKAQQGLPPGIDTNAPLDIWSALDSFVFANTLFVGFLVMVGSRLNDDLRARNGILSDEIARRQALERQLTSALATEVRMRSEQQKLIHIIGHEIRSPLAGIDRATELLMMADAAILQRVAGIRERVRHMIGMIDRLLASERHSYELARPAPMVLQEVIAIVLRGFADADLSDMIHLVVPDQPVELVADQSMMMAIMRNLIDNAVKYSPPDEAVTVTVTHGTDEVSILVQDQGIGIPDIERDLVGQRFFRASNVGAIAGTGLGIFAVRRLLAAQGGRLAIKAGMGGRGTTMIATLPLVCRSHAPDMEAVRA